MSEYAEAAKKLISVCNRLEKWFVGERLYETVYASTDDEFEISFRWDYGSKHFEYLTEEKGWKKVINTKYPLLMANLITLIPTLHQKAQARKAEVGEALSVAASAGEMYLSDLSGFVDDNFREEEASDNKEITIDVRKS